MNICPCCGYREDRIDLDIIPDAARLTESERRVFEAFRRRFGHFINTYDLAFMVYADDPDGGPDSALNTVAVILQRMKRKIEPYGVEIESLLGRGGGRRMVWSSKVRASR